MEENTVLEWLDATDRRILEQLQRDASVSNHALAALVHTSPATCLRRVRRLKDAGVIARVVALLDGAKLGSSLTAIAEVTLDRQGVEHLQAFEHRAAAHPAVQQCYRVTPGPDFVLVARAADMSAWSKIVDALFSQDANVRNVKTYFTVACAKFEPAVDVGAASGG